MSSNLDEVNSAIQNLELQIQQYTRQVMLKKETLAELKIQLKEAAGNSDYVNQIQIRINKMEDEITQLEDAIKRVSKQLKAMIEQRENLKIELNNPDNLRP